MLDRHRPIKTGGGVLRGKRQNPTVERFGLIEAPGVERPIRPPAQQGSETLGGFRQIRLSGQGGAVAVLRSGPSQGVAQLALAEMVGRGVGVWR